MNSSSAPEPYEEDSPRLAADRLAIFQELSPSLERIAWAILRDWQLAADAVQETFVLLAEKVNALEDGNFSVDEQAQPSPGLASTEHFRGWLIKTVQYQALNIRRKQNRHATGVTTNERRDSSQREFRRSGHSGSVPDAAVSESPPGLELESQEWMEQLAAAVTELPIEQRRVVEARLSGNRTFAEIADDEGVSLGTVLSRMRLALKKLRARLIDE